MDVRLTRETGLPGKIGGALTWESPTECPVGEERLTEEMLERKNSTWIHVQSSAEAKNHSEGARCNEGVHSGKNFRNSRTTSANDCKRPADLSSRLEGVL